jgi:hypothetical protein
MKVRMNIHITGSRNGVRWPAAGGEVVLPDNEAADLCAQGLAEPVVDTKPEKAVPDKPVEKRGGRGRSKPE